MSDIKTNITINVVEPGSSTPVVPNTSTIESISTPDTGLFTSGIGAKEATIIGIVAFIVLVAIASAIIHYHNKKHGKITKLIRLLAKYRNTVRSKKKLSIPLASLALVVSLGTFASLIKAGANAEGADNAEAQDNASLTLGVSSPDLTIEVGNEPVFAILPVELTVEEATRAGYTLTAYADSTDIVSTTNPNNIIPMVTVDSEEDLVFLTDNTYGISLSEPTSKDDKVYTTLSTNQNTPTTLKTIDDYSPTETEDKTTIYYGFYITPDIPKGTYEGSSIYYEAEPNHATILNFDGNGSDGGEAMEGITIPAGVTVALPKNTFTRDGYTFTGWNTVANPTDDNPGTSYIDQSGFTASSTSMKNIVLYATWTKTIGNLTYMQDFKTLSEKDKSTVLQSMTEDKQYQLRDNRDQKQYFISKLKDGNVWMTQNLDLDLSIETTLTPVDTNITEDWTPMRSTISFANSSVPGWDNDGYTPYSADPGDVYYYTSNSDENDIRYNSLADCEAAGHTDCTHYHAGNYYNWTAAVASNDSSDMQEMNINAPYSICPAGWTLPEGLEDFNNPYNDMSHLASSYSNTLTDLTWGCGHGCKIYEYLSGGFVNMRNTPLWFIRSGGIEIRYGTVNAALYEGASVGYYWSKTMFDTYAIRLRFDNKEVRPDDSYGRHQGFSVRCLAE